MMLKLPDFPWDSLAAAKERAAGHPGGIVDLSVGTPVDDTPEIARKALDAASNAHGYPTVWGTPECRQSIIDYLTREWGVQDLVHEGVLPVIGTKEFVGLLPFMLGLGAGDAVVFPSQAYPTYEVGALAAGAEPVPCDDPRDIPANTKLVWLNSPGNPNGRILSRDELRAWVAKAREMGAVLASDECYGEFVWEQDGVTPETCSVLNPDICGASHDALVAVHSVSKRSNAAGYRGGFAAGDPKLIQGLIEVRKHLGMMVPAPVQAAMAVMLNDQNHVREQVARYQRRRDLLKPALEQAGFRIDHSEGSLYLWATRGEPCRDTVAWFAERGILVAPGDFYGDDTHVRVALTATDERIAAAVERLRG